MRRFSPEEIVEIWSRLGGGQSVRSIAIGLGRYSSAVRQLVKGTGGALPLVAKSRGPRFLFVFEREEISRGVFMDLSARFIAKGLNRSPSTISRARRPNASNGKKIVSHSYPANVVNEGIVVSYGENETSMPSTTKAIARAIKDVKVSCH